VSAIVGDFKNRPDLSTSSGRTSPSLTHDLEPQGASSPSFASQLLNAEQTAFRGLTTSRFDTLKDQLSQILPLIPSTSPEVVDLQNEIARLTVTQKELRKALDGLQDEKKELEEKNQDMEYSWGICRTKLAKSQTKVATYLEMQSRSHTKADKKETKQNGKVNGAVEEPVVSAEAESARQAAVLKSKKLKEQVESLEAEVASLTTDLTAARTKAASLTDEDYAHTDLFKASKKRMEELIANANDLTARCRQAEEDVRKLQEERTAYQREIEEACRLACEKSEQQMKDLNMDLTRIRTERDELNADKTILEANQGRDSETLQALQDLNSANDDRIAALESEAKRLRLKAGEEEVDLSVLDKLADQSPEALKKEAARLVSQSSALNLELSSMQAAVTKFRKQAQEKVALVGALEKEAQKLRESKIRAEATVHQHRTVVREKRMESEKERQQHAKSGDIILQLKEAENKARELCANLEKQLAGRTDELARATERSRALAAEAAASRTLAQQHEARAGEMARLASAREADALAARRAQREAEADGAGAAGALAAAEAEAREWRGKAEGNSTEELTMLRVSNHSSFESPSAASSKGPWRGPYSRVLAPSQKDRWLTATLQKVAYCNACNSNIKERFIRPCGHIVCQPCGDQRIQARDRRCPLCNRAFGASDLLPVHLV
jgi:E3 ubiquitin-protein ligase BRE1